MATIAAKPRPIMKLEVSLLTEKINGTLAAHQVEHDSLAFCRNEGARTVTAQRVVEIVERAVKGLGRARIDAFRNQVLIVLADYQNTRDGVILKFHEGRRQEITRRLLANLKLIVEQ